MKTQPQLTLDLVYMPDEILVRHQPDDGPPVERVYVPQDANGRGLTADEHAELEPQGLA